MISRTDLDSRIDAHQVQSKAVNLQQWQFETAPQPSRSLRRGLAAKLVTLASKFDSSRSVQRTAAN